MKNKSFTLIELLVVIVIIGVLAAVIVVTTTSSVSNATLARAKAFSSNVSNSMLLNLVSEWTFDEPEFLSRKTKDSWGVNNATVVGATRSDGDTGECVFGGCYSFDGSGDYIDFDNASYLIYNDFSINWWFKKNNSSYECIFATAPDGSYGQIEVTSLNEIRFESKTNNIYQVSMSTNLNLSDGNWHNFVLSSSPSEFSLYSDGVKTFSGSANTDMVSQDFGYIGVQQLQGTFTYGDYFTGYIDDVRIYNAALSSSQIKQNYIAGLNSMLANGSMSKVEYDQRIEALANIDF